MKPDVEVRRSSIHALGVYALRDFRAGEVVLRWDTSRTIANDKLDSLSDEERCYTHPFNQDTTIIVQPPERYVNHSCASNTVVRRFCDVAIRDICAGEEITSDYSSDKAGLKFACLCGALNCRGSVE